MNELAEIEVEEELDLGYEELPPIMVDKRFFIDESFDLMTQGNFILNSLNERSYKDSDGNNVLDLGYATWIVAILCGSLSGVLERLNENLSESERKRLQLGDALAGLTAHIGSLSRVEDSIEKMNKSITLASREYRTLEEAANELGIALDTLYQWVQDGRLGCAKIGGKNSYFLKSEIEKVIAENYRCNPRKMTNKEKVEQVLYGKNH